MQETAEDDPEGLCAALEKALLTKSADVVKVLVDFNADCSTVSCHVRKAPPC